MLLTCVVVDTAQLTSWSMVLFGTATAPHYLADYLSSRSLTTMHTVETVDSSSNTNAHHSSNSTASAGRFTVHSGTESEPVSSKTGLYICLFTLC